MQRVAQNALDIASLSITITGRKLNCVWIVSESSQRGFSWISCRYAAPDLFLSRQFFSPPLSLAQKVTMSQPTIWATKPDVAAFDKIENDRLAAGQALDRHAARRQRRTTPSRTLSCLSTKRIRQINSAAYFAGLMQQVHPDAAFRDHATAMVTKASAAQTAISLNHDVYNALAALDLSKADAATRYYVQRQLARVSPGRRRQGRCHARAPEEVERPGHRRAIHVRSQHFRRTEGGRGRSLRTRRPAAGLHRPPQARTPDGKVHITTDYPDALPVFSFAKSESLRRRVIDCLRHPRLSQEPGSSHQPV